MAEQLSFALPLRPALDRDAFMVTSSNGEAVSLIDHAAQWESPVQWIYGPAGCGKTHLAAVLAQDFNVLTLNAQALAQNPDLEALLRGENGANMVVMEALDSLQMSDEESLFHVLNHTRHNTGQTRQKLLLLSREPAARLSVTLPDLASRLKAVPAIAMGSPDDALVGGLLAKLFADLQLRVDDKVIAYMVPRIERDFAAMGRLVTAIDQRALALKKPVTVRLVAAIMSAYDDPQ
jgi:chromosomal replication initiation ATPase DnaA